MEIISSGNADITNKISTNTNLRSTQQPASTHTLHMLSHRLPSSADALHHCHHALAPVSISNGNYFQWKCRHHQQNFHQHQSSFHAATCIDTHSPHALTSSPVECRRIAPPPPRTSTCLHFQWKLFPVEMQTSPTKFPPTPIFVPRSNLHRHTLSTCSHIVSRRVPTHCTTATTH